MPTDDERPPAAASLPMVSALTTHDDCLMPRTLIQVRASVNAVIVAALRGKPVGERRPIERRARASGRSRPRRGWRRARTTSSSRLRSRRIARRRRGPAGIGPPVDSKRLPTSRSTSAIDSDSNPTAMNASGPHGPTRAATSEGSRKIALPITWLTPIAVRSHLPSARRSAGASGAPAIGLVPSGDQLLDAAASVSAVNGFINKLVTPVGSSPAPARSG